MILFFSLLFLAGSSSFVFAKKKKPTFKTKILNRHNRLRSFGGLKKMKWNKKIAANAKKWAEKLKKTKNCNMMHSSSSSRKNVGGFSYLGENLYWSWGSSPSKVDANMAKKAVNSWYSEIRDFKYSKKGVICPKRNKKGMIGHFTQVMWDKSTSLGCAAAQCGGGKTTVVVCQYGPGGNFNQSVTPPFGPKARLKLHKHKYNKKYGGLPTCD
jgi:hypothetical protein